MNAVIFRFAAPLRLLFQSFASVPKAERSGLLKKEVWKHTLKEIFRLSRREVWSGSFNELRWIAKWIIPQTFSWQTLPDKSWLCKSRFIQKHTFQERFSLHQLKHCWGPQNVTFWIKIYITLLVVCRLWFPSSPSPSFVVEHKMCFYSLFLLHHTWSFLFSFISLLFAYVFKH